MSLDGNDARDRLDGDEDDFGLGVLVHDDLTIFHANFDFLSAEKVVNFVKHFSLVFIILFRVNRRWRIAKRL